MKPFSPSLRDATDRKAGCTALKHETFTQTRPAEHGRGRSRLFHAASAVERNCRKRKGEPMPGGSVISMAQRDPWSMPLDEIDVSDIELWRTDSHWPFFARLRRDDPCITAGRAPSGRIGR